MAPSTQTQKPKSQFVVTLTELFHKQDFTGAAEHIEKSLLDAGVQLLNSKLPPPMAAMAGPAEQDLEQGVVTATGDAMSGNTKAVGNDLASSLGQALIDTLGRFGLKLG